MPLKIADDLAFPVADRSEKFPLPLLQTDRFWHLVFPSVSPGEKSFNLTAGIGIVAVENAVPQTNFSVVQLVRRAVHIPDNMIAVAIDDLVGIGIENRT